MRGSSLVVRITGWYDWLLVVLVLAFGAYTYECLDYCLSIGVKKELSIRAKEIAGVFAKTGQIAVHQTYYESEVSDRFVSVHRSGGAVRDLSAKPDTQATAPINVLRELNSHTSSVRSMANGAFPVVATVPLTIGRKKYVVEVGTPKRSVRAVLRGSARRLLVGLIVGLALATLGSCIFVKRALVPVRKIFLAVQALPVVPPNERSKSVALLGEIERLSVIVNKMVGRLEESFHVGAGLPPEAFLEPSTRLETVRAELANLFKNKRLSVGVAQNLLDLLKETERLSDMAGNLSRLSDEDGRQIRTKRLRFYLGGFAAAGLEHVRVLTQKLGADLASEARNPSGDNFLVHW